MEAGTGKKCGSVRTVVRPEPGVDHTHGSVVRTGLLYVHMDF